MLKVKIPQNHIGNSSALILFSSKLYVGKIICGKNYMWEKIEQKVKTCHKF